MNSLRLHSRKLSLGESETNKRGQVLIIQSFHISQALENGHTLNYCPNFVQSFQEFVSKVITHPVFYVDLVYKLRRFKSAANCNSSGSKIVKRLRRRQHDPAIIERTIGLVLGPFTASLHSELQAIWTNIDITSLIQSSSETTLSWSSSPLIVSQESFSLWIWACLMMDGTQLTLTDVTRYFWYSFDITICVCVVYFNYLSALVGCWSPVSIMRIIYNFFIYFLLTLF